ncbi:MAG: hypothetical protein AABW58_02350 [Nanoarchaeota archaeon]
MQKEGKITNPKEIADLVDSGKLNLRDFLGLKSADTETVVNEFLQRGYNIDVTYDKEGKPISYGMARPFSKAALQVAGICSAE